MGREEVFSGRKKSYAGEKNGILLLKMSYFVEENICGWFFCEEHVLFLERILESYHRMTEWPGLKRTTILIQFQPPALCRVTNQQTRLPRALYFWEENSDLFRKVIFGGRKCHSLGVEVMFLGSRCHILRRNVVFLGRGDLFSVILNVINVILVTN